MLPSKADDPPPERERRVRLMHPQRNKSFGLDRGGINSLCSTLATFFPVLLKALRGTIAEEAGERQHWRNVHGGKYLPEGMLFVHSFRIHSPVHGHFEAHALHFVASLDGTSSRGLRVMDSGPTQTVVRETRELFGWMR